MTLDLNNGDIIGLIAPSSPPALGRLESGVAYLEKIGFKVKVGAHVKKSDRFLAGSDAERASDVMDFYRDPDVKAIMAMSGGYGSQRILPLLDFDIIRQNSKSLVGFSDTTALQLGIYQQTGLTACTGFTFRDTDPGKPDPLVAHTLISCLMGHSYVVTEGSTLYPGIVEGRLICGTLSLIVALLGTPYQPNFKDSILLIEEVWAEPFQVDSMLTQLKQAGVLKQVAGLIFGQFVECVAHHTPERDGTIEDVINEWSTKFKIPSIQDFPYGHGDRRCVLPIGKSVRLNADTPKLEIL
jgi:muramoyltetrapeptide carboxypeptidase